jgi:hypothetical protein
MEKKSICPSNTRDSMKIKAGDIRYPIQKAEKITQQPVVKMLMLKPFKSSPPYVFPIAISSL